MKTKIKHTTKIIFLIVGVFVLAGIVLGCGTTTNRLKVMDRFRSIHGCEPESASGLGTGGYIVRGCGIESHFSCFDTGHNDSNESTIVGVIFDLAFESADDVCLHEYSRGSYRSPRYEKPAIVVNQTGGGREKIQANLLIGEGRLIVAGVPSQFEDQVGCIYQPLTEVSLPHSCGVEFLADGHAIGPEKVMRSGEGKRTNIQFILSPNDLSKMYQSDRVLGSICEQPVRFNHTQLELLREFLIQFETALVGGVGEKAQTAGNSGS